MKWIDRTLGHARRWARSPWVRVIWALLVLAPTLGLLVGGFERRWMDEDGFINLRIVRNVFHGYGPVFNLDERVESGTSPLWLAFEVVLGAIGIRLEYIAVFGAIALTAVGLVLAQDGAWRLGERPRERSANGPGELAGSECNERLAGAIRVPLPLGAMMFAVLPPAWDYASSGLETGLSLAWLGASFDALARASANRSDRHGSRARAVAGGMLIGLGPLIRPEFAVYSAVFFVPFAGAILNRSGPAGKRGAIFDLVRIAACAVALPVAYQVFRMGYYASATPNTAIAKEAFLVNWSQGHCYLDTFVATYHLAWPLMAAGVFWIARLHHHVKARQWLALGVAVGVPAAAAIHVAYLVAIGGDYMHGRLLVPAAFATLLPIMTVPAEAPRVPLGRSVLATAGVAIVAWSIVCWVHFRVGVENVCGVGDERGWYSRTAGVDNPVTIESYAGHFFASSARQWLDRIRATCPDVSSPWHGVVEPGCRNVYIADDKAPIVPAPQVAPAVRDLDPRIAAVVPVGAIGVVGYMLPERVHVIDVNGLSDPVVGRFELHTRGRPGPEKTLPAAWPLARYSEPAADEDASVTAARHALSCGALSALERGVTQPLTVRSFLDNVAHAWDFSRVRIPRDPFEAEERFCGLAPRPELTAGGGGGTPFRWLCARGRTVTGLRGAFKDSDHAISLLQAVCTSNRVETPDDDRGLVGPPFGEASDDAFEVTCPPETSVAGIYGSNGDFVRSVGLVCSRPGKSLRTSAGGVSQDRAFALVCPDGTAVVGVTGRSGALVDAAGVVCGPAERR